ncbi:MAG TPA: electron transfer flavoprotein subunit alpha/FixB family protein [Myxococcota bacterium]|nr:electron transfer flavoprotein subunit alpha/FixB family protein [Myxococcota bacterium]
MGNALIIAEHKDGKLKKASLAAFSCARDYVAKTGGEFHILVIGHDISAVADQAACYGAAKVHMADHEKLGPYLAESHAAIAAKVAGDMGAELVGATATAMAKDMLPRLAAKLGAGMASDILGIDDNGHFLRPVWAGNAIVAVEITTAVKVVTIRGTEFDPAPKGEPGGEKVAVTVNIDFDKPGKRFIRFEEVKSERPELTEANMIVSGGRGTKGEEGFKLIEGLADLLGAAVGATRAAVDAGWVPNDLQVGQTGKVVAPDLYVAIGISGAIQHLAGMKSSKTIVAINKDEEAPIFSVADYGLVADLFKAVPELVEEIKKAKQ